MEVLSTESLTIILMRDTVVVKWGGGLITNKSVPCSPDTEIISKLADELMSYVMEGNDVILIHGAGSFGHLKAKQHRIHLGYSGEKKQMLVVDEIRKDMMALNALVMASITSVGAKTFHPHQWAKNTGSNFLGALPHSSPVTVVHGDVVPTDDVKRFGILSGDHLVERYALEKKNVKRVVFAMRGADGILARPPDVATEVDLIEDFDVNMSFQSVHHEEIDVTGGIGLKVSCGIRIAQSGTDVHFINGDISYRLGLAMRGLPVRGTIIHGGNN